MSYSPEVTESAAQWMVKYRATEDPKVLSQIVDRAQENLERLGGRISISSFERAYLELVNEKAIQPFRGTITTKVDAPAIPQEIVEFIESPRVSAFEQRRRYSTDPAFKKYYDLYANQQLKARIAEESGSTTLSVDDYQRMPSTLVAQKYHRDKGFRAQVDALIAQGLI
jgi:hypothetical protein